MNTTCDCCTALIENPSAGRDIVFNSGYRGIACLDWFDDPAPKVVCLVGSTRFFDAFARANLDETLKGNIVLSIGCDTHHVDAEYTEQQKRALDRLHKRKINKADEVLVLNVGGYIGKSTASEISWATKQAIPIRYLEPID